MFYQRASKAAPTSIVLHQSSHRPPMPRSSLNINNEHSPTAVFPATPSKWLRPSLSGKRGDSIDGRYSDQASPAPSDSDVSDQMQHTKDLEVPSSCPIVNSPVRKPSLVYQHQLARKSDGNLLSPSSSSINSAGTSDTMARQSQSLSPHPASPPGSPPLLQRQLSQLHHVPSVITTLSSPPARQPTAAVVASPAPTTIVGRSPMIYTTESGASISSRMGYSSTSAYAFTPNPVANTNTAPKSPTITSQSDTSLHAHTSPSASASVQSIISPADKEDNRYVAIRLDRRPSLPVDLRRSRHTSNVSLLSPTSLEDERNTPVPPIPLSLRTTQTPLPDEKVDTEHRISQSDDPSVPLTTSSTPTGVRHQTANPSFIAPPPPTTNPPNFVALHMPQARPLQRASSVQPSKPSSSPINIAHPLSPPANQTYGFSRDDRQQGPVSSIANWPRSGTKSMVSISQVNRMRKTSEASQTSAVAEKNNTEVIKQQVLTRVLTDTKEFEPLPLLEASKLQDVGFG